MKTVIVIPARYASTRLPGKPLLRETGKYLLQHVYEQALQAQCSDEVIIATDDPRIQAAARKFGGRCIMTRRGHASGMDRVAEVARSLDADIIINLQGDEPLIRARDIECLAQQMSGRTVQMATLAVPIRRLEQYRDPNCVKVVCDGAGNALYFSRASIPFSRDGEPDLDHDLVLQHIGLYAYRRPFLLQLTASPPHPLESIEKLEQLRALASGFQIRVGVIEQAWQGVDTYEDYRRFVNEYRGRNCCHAA